MSGYNIEYFLKDFADRTIENLDYIESRAKQDNLYEVTQLINSLLGLIIIPVEYYKRQGSIKDDDLRIHSLKEYNEVVQILKKCEKEKRIYSDYDYDREYNGNLKVSHFIRHVRNAIAHGGNNGIHFYPVSECGHISHIILYDNDASRKNGSNNIHEFGIKLDIAELKKLVNVISKMYCNFENKNRNVNEKQEKYSSDIRKLESFLKNGRTEKTKVIFELEE